MPWHPSVLGWTPERAAPARPRKKPQQHRRKGLHHKKRTCSKSFKKTVIQSGGRANIRRHICHGNHVSPLEAMHRLGTNDAPQFISHPRGWARKDGAGIALQRLERYGRVLRFFDECGIMAFAQLSKTRLHCRVLLQRNSSRPSSCRPATCPKFRLHRHHYARPHLSAGRDILQVQGIGLAAQWGKIAEKLQIILERAFRVLRAGWRDGP